MCVKSNLYKVAFTFVLPPDHNSGPWCKMLLSSEENVVICKAHGLQNSWIHYSCFTSMCVAKKDQSRLSASLCKLSRRCLDLSFMFLCQSRVNDNMKNFLRVLRGAVRNSPERTMFFSSFWAELAELPTDVWLFPGISSACTSLDSHYLLVQSWSTLEQHWNWP